MNETHNALSRKRRRSIDLGNPKNGCVRDEIEDEKFVTSSSVMAAGFPPEDTD